MLNLPSNKLCKLKSKWQHGGNFDTWILVYPTFTKTDESAPFGPLISIRHKFCLIHFPYDLRFKVDDTLFLTYNEDWILDKPTAEDMLFLGNELRKTNRYAYNLKTKELIDKNPPLELPF